MKHINLIVYLSGIGLTGCQGGALDLGPVKGDALVDQDGDGFTSDEDCDDSNEQVNPGASEEDVGSADGVDDDCSGYPDDVVVCDGESEDYAAIQDAIDSVPEGFLIRICAGTYFERLSISSQDVSLLGIEGAERTIIDAESKGSALTLERGADVSVEGLTLRNGLSQEVGGGMFCDESALSLVSTVVSDGEAANGGGFGASGCEVNVQASTFKDSAASEMGGGIYFVDSTGTLSDSVIVGNTAVEGGGIALFEVNITVEGNDISENLATTTDESLWGPGGGGGGIWSAGGSALINNRIHHNISQYHGGGFYLRRSSPEVRDNLVYDNGCYEDGAGGYTNRSGAWVHDNEFTHNIANDDAGGFRVYVGQNMTIEDNLFDGNEAGDDAGGMKLSHSSNVIRRNLFVGNKAGDAGGGLELDNETSDVSECEFRDNTASRGAGLHSWRNEGRISIQNSLFLGNRARFCGGAIQMDNNPYEVLLHQLEIAENTSDVDGAAVCTHVFYQDDEQTVSEPAVFRMTNSTLAWNAAGDDGGAFYIEKGEMTLENVTAHGNTAGDDGGGIAMKAESSAEIVNLILSKSGAEGVYVEEVYDDDEIPSEGVSISYSNVWGSADENYQGMEDATGTSGTLSVPPGYTDAKSDDFSLKTNSQCVDAGDPSLKDKDGSVSDMGATGGKGAP